MRLLYQKSPQISPGALVDSTGNVEEHEVLVEVVEVPSILLVEVVGKFGLRVVLRGNALVIIHDSERIAVEDACENARRGNG